MSCVYGRSLKQIVGIYRVRQLAIPRKADLSCSFDVFGDCFQVRVVVGVYLTDCLDPHFIIGVQNEYRIDYAVLVIFCSCSL